MDMSGNVSGRQNNGLRDDDDGSEAFKSERKKTHAIDRSDLGWDASRPHPAGRIFEHHDKHPEIQHETTIRVSPRLLDKERRL
jgi:hypothetical protein